MPDTFSALVLESVISPSIPGCLYRMLFRNQYLGSMCATWYWSVTVCRPFQWKQCMYTNSYTHTQTDTPIWGDIYIYIFM